MNHSCQPSDLIIYSSPSHYFCPPPSTAPENLIAPNIQYTAGSSAIVTWSPAGVENGLVLGYDLQVHQVATFVQSPQLSTQPSATIAVSSQTFSYMLTNLLASRFYAVRLVCFTAGGSVSTVLVNFTTTESGKIIYKRS